MSKKLNDKQRKLVEDNHGIIYSYLNSHNLSYDDVEDWYGLAAIGLCKAALAYDETRNVKFSTLAYICIHRTIVKAIDKDRKRIHCSHSLDEPFNDEQDMFYGDTISDKSSPSEDQFILSRAIEESTNELNDRDKMIIDCITNRGMKQVEVASQLGLTRASISRVFVKFMNSVNERICC